MSEKIKQTAGRDQLGDFAPMFAHLNDDVLFGEVWNEEAIDVKTKCIITVVCLMASGITDSSLVYHLQNAKAHGFNETEDIERTLMLIITEIGEAVDAHRKGWKAEGNRSWYDAVIEKTTDIDKRMTAFEGYIKNNLEDELADVVIRIASLCGACADNLEADKEQWKAAERQAT